MIVHRLMGFTVAVPLGGSVATTVVTTMVWPLGSSLPSTSTAVAGYPACADHIGHSNGGVSGIGNRDRDGGGIGSIALGILNGIREAVGARIARSRGVGDSAVIGFTVAVPMGGSVATTVVTSIVWPLGSSLASTSTAVAGVSSGVLITSATAMGGSAGSVTVTVTVAALEVSPLGILNGIRGSCRGPHSPHQGCR